MKKYTKCTWRLNSDGAFFYVQKKVAIIITLKVHYPINVFCIHKYIKNTKIL